MKKQLLFALLAAVIVCAAQTAPPAQRPRILGVAHIALQTNDMTAAQEFYGHVMGYATLTPSPSSNARYFKVNDHQYIEIFPDLKSDTQDRLIHVAFETDNARQLRNYLATRNVAVPAAVKPDTEGNLTLTLKDPEGHEIQFVQYLPTSLHGRNFGKLISPARISKHIIHVGFTIEDRKAADAFFHDILGFELMWYGGKTEDRVDYVDMRVPDGSDWLEYMLNVRNPTPKTLGVMNHLALGVDSIQPAHQSVLERGHTPCAPPKLGVDGKWQLNLYDATLTRTEYMEFTPVQKPCCSPMLKPPVMVRE